MRARHTQVRGVPPAIVAPVGGANPGDGCHSPSPLIRPGPGLPRAPQPGRVEQGAVECPSAAPEFLSMIPKSGPRFSDKDHAQTKRALRMAPDNSLDFAATR